MKASTVVKENGLKDMATLESISGVQVRTLQNWFKTKRWLFDAIVEKASKEAKAV